MRRLLITTAALLALAACTEKPQQIGSSKKPAEAAWKGTDNGYVAPGWKAGDETSWEAQMKNRAQQGQNEYTRTTGAS
jgi:hypothetical protein